MTVNLPAFTSNPPQIHHQKTTFCTPFLPKPPAKTGKPAPRKNYCKSNGTQSWLLLILQGRWPWVVAEMGVTEGVAMPMNSVMEL
jgi:hypothetical protein